MAENDDERKRLKRSIDDAYLEWLRMVWARRMTDDYPERLRDEERIAAEKLHAAEMAFIDFKKREGEGDDDDGG